MNESFFKSLQKEALIFSKMQEILSKLGKEQFLSDFQNVLRMKLQSEIGFAYKGKIYQNAFLKKKEETCPKTSITTWTIICMCLKRT